MGAGLEMEATEYLGLRSLDFVAFFEVKAPENARVKVEDVQCVASSAGQ